MQSICRPPCEVVNWNIFLSSTHIITTCRPPCEVVNWNIRCARSRKDCDVDLLVRSWIEIWMKIKRQLWKQVDLLVRSWIEILKSARWSALIWVDLLVRSWIEITNKIVDGVNIYVDLLVRSWIEILTYAEKNEMKSRRPPCEVVNWNVALIF